MKEPDNYYDQEAIRCQVKHIGTVGYVANSTYTVAVGTKSAGRIAHKVKKKFKVQLGLFHDNMFNQFNLASDLMEPFRVLIDQKVLQMKLIDFEHSEKMQLVDILNQEVLIDGKNQYVNNAKIMIHCASVFIQFLSNLPCFNSITRYNQGINIPFNDIHN